MYVTENDFSYPENARVDAPDVSSLINLLTFTIQYFIDYRNINTFNFPFLFPIKTLSVVDHVPLSNFEETAQESKSSIL